MIIVLMSTYNGEKYLKEQIESILSQTGVDVSLFVRDDGSNDSTPLILERYKKEGKLDYYVGENKGWKKSFMDLIQSAPAAEYYAFCDQDDYWMPNKLIEAYDKIKSLPEGIRLYVSNCFYWKNGQILGLTKKTQPEINKYSCHLWIQAPGCTYLFNKKLLDTIRENPPKIEVEHDGWLFRTANLLGNIVFDMNSYIKYRQHGDNQEGASFTFKERSKRRFRAAMHLFDSHELEVRSKELLNCYGNMMDLESFNICNDVANYRKSLIKYFKLIFSKKYSCENKLRTFGFKLRVVLRHL